MNINKRDGWTTPPPAYRENVLSLNYVEIKVEFLNACIMNIRAGRARWLFAKSSLKHYKG